MLKLSKDKKGIIRREQLTQHWTDWIDYWSVDFDFESKREIFGCRTRRPARQRKSGLATICSRTSGRAYAPKKTAPWHSKAWRTRSLQGVCLP